jgi:hypothetical protein
MANWSAAWECGGVARAKDGFSLALNHGDFAFQDVDHFVL